MVVAVAAVAVGVVVAVTLVAIVKSAINVTKWDILHVNAKKMPTDVTDATVSIKPFLFNFYLLITLIIQIKIQL